MDLPVKGIVRPSTLTEASAVFFEDPNLLPIAGGTDISVQLRAGMHPDRRLLDLSRVLPTSISTEGGFLRIGAGATMDVIADSTAVRSVCPALSESARQVGAWPIQCRATLGGNLANASPAADTAPPLLVADARVEVIGQHGSREIEISNFFSGPGATSLEPGELIQAVNLPVTDPPSFSRFSKLGWQREQIISVVSLGINLRLDEVLRVSDAAIALGAVAPTPKRAPAAEAALIGRVLEPAVINEAVKAVQDDISPIDDVRAPAWYRRVAAATLLDRRLGEATDV